MRTVYRLPFRLFGIPIQLDLTFLLILPLFTWLIGTEIERLVIAFELETNADYLTEGYRSYLIGFLSAIGLFASVLIHEIGHSLVGRAFNLKIKSITLWILGGMAQFERIPKKRGTEAIMAIAGPVTSIGLGLVAKLCLDLTPASFHGVRFIFTYLMYMNFVLAAFNLLPALPLDGGRVLRSLLALRLPWVRATVVAASASKVLAILMGLLGLLFLNFWLIVMAFFIFVAVSGESQDATISSMLRGILVRDLMTTEVRAVPPDMLVTDLISQMFRERHLAYPVIDGDRNVLGLVTLQNIRELKASGGNESGVRVREIMSRGDERISELSSALEAFQRISQNRSGRLIVTTRDGKLSGIISKTDLIRAVQVRTVETDFEH